MQFFDDFDEEKRTNPNTKISVIEKGTIMVIIIFVKVILRKVRRAKTYEDLYDLMDFCSMRFKEFEEKYPNGDSITTEEHIKDAENILLEISKEIKEEL